MARRLTPKGGARYFRSYKKRIERETAVADDLSGQAGVEIAHKWSSGNASSRLLARLGHPYGLGERDFTPFNPALINRQTTTDGAVSFFASWTYQVVTKNGRRVLQIRNSAPYAHFLDTGTKTSIPRPFREAILKELRPIRLRNLRAAMRRARRA